MVRLILAVVLALILSAIEIILVIFLYVHFADSKPIIPKYVKGIVSACICISLIIPTWAILISKNDGVLRSKVDLELIASLTEEKLESNLPILASHIWVGLYQRNQIDDNTFYHSMYYRRRNEMGEYTLGSVDISIRVIKNEVITSEKLQKPSGNFDHYVFGSTEAYVGRPVVNRNYDTFFIPDSQRWIYTYIWVGKYFIRVSEHNYQDQLNDLRTNDVLRILNGEYVGLSK